MLERKEVILPNYKATLQEIKITWSKESRGGSAAAQRNKVAHALPLPLARVDKRDWFLFEHQAFFTQQDAFTKPHEYGGSYYHCSLFNVRHLNLIFDEEQVQVIWASDTPIGRGTSHVPLHKLLFTLHPDEWGQVVYNYRVGHITYEKIVINVGVFTKVIENVFTSSKPTYTFNKIVPLY